MLSYAAWTHRSGDQTKCHTIPQHTTPPCSGLSVTSQRTIHHGQMAQPSGLYRTSTVPATPRFTFFPQMHLFFRPAAFNSFFRESGSKFWPQTSKERLRETFVETFVENFVTFLSMFQGSSCFMSLICYDALMSGICGSRLRSSWSRAFLSQILRLFCQRCLTLFVRPQLD